LAEVVAQFPGIGGRVGEAVERSCVAIRSVPPTSVRRCAFWVEHALRPRAGRADLCAAREDRAIRDYFGARLAGQDANRSAAAATGFAQAAAVRRSGTLAAQGSASIAPTELEALVAQCTARGAPNRNARAGRLRSVRVRFGRAGGKPFDRVVWWQMGAPSLPGHYAWSASEIASLARAGVELPPLAEVLNRRGEDWLRPVLNARRQLVLVLPPQGEEMHPLWQEIQWFVEGVRPEPLESLLTGHAGNDLPAIAHAALPGRRRWWHLPAQAKIPPRARESYSSLNTFLNAPHQWVLKYAARLNPSNLLAVADENLLYGNLAHPVDRSALPDEWRSPFAAMH
jgi:hypothetical protein